MRKPSSEPSPGRAPRRAGREAPGHAGRVRPRPRSRYDPRVRRPARPVADTRRTPAAAGPNSSLGPPALLDRVRDVLLANPLLAREVGDGARELHTAVPAARAQAELPVGLLEHPPRREVQVTVATNLGGRHLRVGPPLAEALLLCVAGPDDPVAHGTRVLGILLDKLLGRRRIHMEGDVDAIREGPAELR